MRLDLGPKALRQAGPGYFIMRCNVVRLFLLAGLVLTAASSNSAPLPVTIAEGLILPLGGRGGGHAEFPVDFVAAQISDGSWKAPHEGDVLTLPGGSSRTWQKSPAGTNGWFTGRGLGGGYLFYSFHADADQGALLEAAGHEMVYVNGEPRVGDIYANETTLIPVHLRPGENEFLFKTGRGRLKARLLPVKSRAVCNPRDMTLPDFHPENNGNSLGAVIVLNASGETLSGVEMRVTGPSGVATPTLVPSIPAWGMRKVAVPLLCPSPLPAPTNLTFKLALVDRKSGAVLDEIPALIRVLAADQPFKVTFRSSIDGSVQYYAVNPMRSSAPRTGSPALFLSLHGAGVEALGQAQAYSPKSWGYLVAPTNRRPYGFDWEDWGRIDAMEVLDLASRRWETDPASTYLTGHSMGGHGTWQVGVTFPDRFAAIAPSAGWISFSSYAGKNRSRPTNAVDEIIARANSPGDTLLLRSNYLHEAVYILHGGADDNVPPGEARKMKDELTKFHRDFTYFEQPGAGHWWDVSDEPGADCVDWAPFFDTFGRHRVPSDNEVREINFSTANPAVSAKTHWVTIDLQEKALEKSSITLRFDPGRHRFKGGTENVARFSVDVAKLASAGEFVFEIDLQILTNLAVPKDHCFWFERTEGAWAVTGPPLPKKKGAHRAGPFKEAFGHEVVFVYGTAGTKEENEWAFRKARYDAEFFWYRGNGSIEVIPDTEWDASEYQDRGVVIYGNADSNAAWRSLLGQSPIKVYRGRISAAATELEGDNLGAIFVQPRPDSTVASVAVVTGTGVAGMRLNDRLPYLLAGVAYPDWTIYGPKILTDGGGGVLGAGYFGADWGLESGDYAWR